MALLTDAQIASNRKRLAGGKDLIHSSLGAALPADPTGIDATYNATEQQVLTNACNFEAKVADALASIGILDPAEIS